MLCLCGEVVSCRRNGHAPATRGAPGGAGQAPTPGEKDDDTTPGWDDDANPG